MFDEQLPFDVEDNGREKKRRRRKTEIECYTCFLPSGAVQNHIISIEQFTSFHFDMWDRPYIIATPRYHYHTLFEMDPEEQAQLWSDIYFFMKKMGFTDYQCLFNNGEWQTHHHLHIKIRCDEVKIKQLRQLHLMKNK
tara:strand:+ start:2180 stop:2593 length:414 start_codon:yes stop_codon:yes gene_type:complete